MPVTLKRLAPSDSDGAIGVIGRTAAALLDRWGLPKRRFLKRGALRILCYHGVCDDKTLREPWVPSYFVGARAFAQQIKTMQNFGPVVHLPEVIDGLIDGSYAGGAAFAITFDDVAACSFACAQPVLAQAGLRASFYISTGHVTTGRLFNADVLRILRARTDLISAVTFNNVAWLASQPGQYKQLPLEHLRAPLDAAERAVRAKLEPEILETLRPMNWDEVGQLAEAGHEIGGHTVNHVNLDWQCEEVRRQEIEESVRELERRLGRPVCGFAYPNGGADEISRQDAATLKALGVRYAVTTRAGFARGGDMFALPRVCIGAGHTAERFALEISGLLDWRRRRQQGWH